jgi:hypothetical protein
MQLYRGKGENNAESRDIILRIAELIFTTGSKGRS